MFNKTNLINGMELFVLDTFLTFLSPVGAQRAFRRDFQLLEFKISFLKQIQSRIENEL